MKRVTWAVAAAVLWTTAAVAAEPAGKFFFRKGDRVVFLGDSITEQYQYSTNIELYLTTRFPTWDMTFINAGIGGDTATGGAARFREHVLAEKPTAVTIDFGMNDGRYGRFLPDANAQYVRNTEAMLKMAQKAGVRVALISPNAVDVRANSRFKLYLQTQEQFYAPLKGLAEKYHAPFVDQYAVTRAAIEKMTADHAVNVKPFPDGVHTSPGGGLLMAHTILVGLHAPALVSDVEIDAAGGTSKARHCVIGELQTSAKGIAFTRTDEALPLPVEKDCVSMLPYVNELKDLNWYGLRVSGLAATSYDLTIDGHKVGTYAADQLAHGVNLGNLTSGPVHDQGAKVFQAIQAKNDLVHKRFRGVVMARQPNPEELAKRMAEIDRRQAEVYRLAQPTTHRFELKPARSE